MKRLRMVVLLNVTALASAQSTPIDTIVTGSQYSSTTLRVLGSSLELFAYEGRRFAEVGANAIEYVQHFRTSGSASLQLTCQQYRYLGVQGGSLVLNVTEVFNVVVVPEANSALARLKAELETAQEPSLISAFLLVLCQAYRSTPQFRDSVVTYPIYIPTSNNLKLQNFPQVLRPLIDKNSSRLRFEPQ